MQIAAAQRRHINNTSPPIIALLMRPSHHQSPVMLVIDHTAYPAIMDAVIQYASPQALFKLRMTAKSMQRRVDPVLGAHVVLSQRTDDFPPVFESRLYLPKKHRFTPGPKSWQLHTSSAAVRVLDFGYRHLDGPSLTRTFNNFPAATMVRRFAPSQNLYAAELSLPPSAQTVVDYFVLSRYSDGLCVRLFGAPSLQHHPSSGRGPGGPRPLASLARARSGWQARDQAPSSLA